MPNFDHVRLDRLLPYQIRERIAANPTVFIPLGTIEWHSEHLPVGLDALTAEGLCLRVAAKFGGLVYPVLHYGTGGGHGDYPWTVMMPEDLEIAAILRLTLTRLGRLGVRQVVLFTGHFADAQLAMIHAVAAGWNAGGEAMKVLALGVNGNSAAPLPPDHAGRFETTLLAAYHPEDRLVITYLSTPCSVQILSALIQRRKKLGISKRLKQTNDRTL